jgi:tRNA modification GTPase
MHTTIEDTIVAISTPLGSGGIGIVRLSGAESLSIADSILPGRSRVIQHRVPVLASIVEPGTNHKLDRGLVTYYRSPRSYTGEDVVEISCHGSPVLLKAVLGLLINAGARLATPGEFTLRAFLRGRIDLVQAEAVQDLIEARTLFQAKVAHQQIEGSLSHKLKHPKDGLLDLVASLEAGIDFAEDDISVLSYEEIGRRLASVTEELTQLHASYSYGRIVTSGLSLAIVGRPNVGKSSLFNALLKQERAIVTDIPGTTRDLITESVDIRGIPFRLVDTAGIRPVKEKIEQLGIDRSLEALADCDRILLMLDGSEGLHELDYELFSRLNDLPHIVAINKTDLPGKLQLKGIIPDRQRVCRVSAKTGEGLESLKEALVENFDREGALDSEASFITNIRHEELLGQALEALRRVEQSQQSQLPHEILLLDCYSALKALNALTGETTIEDILDNIFSRFCIGK